ncbi:tRNA-uridine aminocarboxypropyltransferase [Agarivorans sp. Alg241-V36]|uniref:tRNA-uridine aminocarboxypropyltransferase n=1 Tax=Agarivorans sp. Alg241-V36 TaxID=2305992 RepID=UPI0013D6A067|nr:tRNA-uridine aminocarboxypropyltransferase [Agarivorans sp. Alg241-V36]
MSRVRCPRCLRPQSHCLCADIPHCTHSHPVIVLQHPSEQQHAKGTAHLACLALGNAQIMVGETEEDFAELKQQVELNPDQFLLIYPSETSQAIEHRATSKNAASVVADSFPTILLLDGTWRKAKKLWHLNPWLQDLEQFHFDRAPHGQYKIRKTSIDKGLSTIEAIGYALNQLEMFDPTPLVGILRALANQQLSAMPAAIKKRY